MKNARYQIKVTLKNIRPPIWRRLLVPADCSMEALHCAIQTAMGWTGAHLYVFRTKDRWIEIPDPDGMGDDTGFEFGLTAMPNREDSAKVHLDEVAKPGEKITYEYDLGDGWEHAILIEKAIKTDDITTRKAECLKGKRACPPEDCGGPWGYQRLLELLDTPAQELDAYGKETLEWIDGEWDAEAFDVDEVNQALANWKTNQISFMYECICG